MRYNSAILSFAFLLLFGISSRGQDNKLITTEFQNEPFKNFVQKIEQLYPCHIFYDTTQLENSTVTVKANQLTLPQLLDRVFNHTSFHYAIDEFNHVFITRQVIQTAFPGNFF